jgi:ATP-binding cassette, subfamily B, bacterial
VEKQFRTARWFRQELKLIIKRGRQVWRLVTTRHKAALGGAAILMAITSAANTAIPLLLGRLVAKLHVIKQDVETGERPDALFRTAMFYLAVISGVYLTREVINVVRRYLVENSCTRVERDMTVRVVGHLLKVHLANLTHEKVGSLHGRLSRSVDGFIRFLRLFFLDFFPAILTGLFALVATLSKEPRLGMVMMGVIPCSVCLTAWQLVSQKNVRLKLLRTREEMDGTVVEQLAAWTTCGRRTPSRKKSAAWPGTPRRGGAARSDTTFRCRCSAPPRPSTRGCSTCWSWAWRSTWRSTV